MTAPEVQQIGRQTHRPHGCALSGGLCEAQPVGGTGFPDPRPDRKPDATGSVDVLMPEVPVGSPGCCPAVTREVLAGRGVLRVPPLHEGAAMGLSPLCVDQDVRHGCLSVGCGPYCHVGMHAVLDHPAGSGWPMLFS